MTATIERNSSGNPIPGQEHKSQFVLHAHGCSGLQGAAVDRRKEKRPSEHFPERTSRESSIQDVQPTIPDCVTHPGGQGVFLTVHSGQGLP